jgi:hypothetical protein
MADPLILFDLHFGFASRQGIFRRFSMTHAISIAREEG